VRVLFVIAHLDKGGGQTVQCLQLYERLRPQVDGRILLLASRPTASDGGLPPGAEVVGRLRFPGGVRDLARAIERVRPQPDLVQVLDIYYALPATRLARAHPVVVRVGSDPVQDLGSRWGFAGATMMRLANPWTFRDTYVVVNSRHLLNWPYHSTVSYIPNAVDPDRFHGQATRAEMREKLGLPPDAPVVVFTGKVVPRKNLEDIFWLLTQIPDLRFLLVGERNEPYYGDSYYRGLLRSFPSTVSRLLAVGEVGMNEIPRYLSAADLFVFPSRLEGMPNSILEAMAAGLPVVASDIEPHRLMMGPGTGFRYQTREQLLRLVAPLVADASLRRAVGDRARNWVVEQYSFESVTRQYLRLYQQVLSGSPVSTSTRDEPGNPGADGRSL
jgi:glycosyltransferase involved in cell wall biosynthesis